MRLPIQRGAKDLLKYHFFPFLPNLSLIAVYFVFYLMSAILLQAWECWARTTEKSPSLPQVGTTVSLLLSFSVLQSAH